MCLYNLARYDIPVPVWTACANRVAQAGAQSKVAHRSLRGQALSGATDEGRRIIILGFAK